MLNVTIRTLTHQDLISEFFLDYACPNQEMMSYLLARSFSPVHSYTQTTFLKHIHAANREIQVILDPLRNNPQITPSIVNTINPNPFPNLQVAWRPYHELREFSLDIFDSIAFQYNAKGLYFSVYRIDAEKVLEYYYSLLHDRLEECKMTPRVFRLDGHHWCSILIPDTQQHITIFSRIFYLSQKVYHRSQEASPTPCMFETIF